MAVLCRMLGLSKSGSRRIVGWAMENHMSTELVVDALEMALWRRKPSAGLVHHSDRGAQYTAISFGKRLAEVGIVPSMGRTGTALDRARASATFPRSRGSEECHLRVPGRVLQPT